MTEEPEVTEADLPSLPDLEAIRAEVMTRYLLFDRKAKHYRHLADEAEQWLDRFDGKKPAKKKRNTNSSRPWESRLAESTYESILTCLGNRAYAGATTLHGASGFSTSTISVAMALAKERGHATIERRGQKYRYTITEAGEEFLTCRVPDWSGKSGSAIAPEDRDQPTTEAAQ